MANAAPEKLLLLCLFIFCSGMALRVKDLRKGNYTSPKQLFLKRAYGMSVRLKCPEIIGKVLWTMNGIFIPCKRGGCDQILEIRKLRRKDAGLYQCWSADEGSPISPAINITVSGCRSLIKREQVKSWPRITSLWPTNANVSVGEVATLRCLVESKLPLKILWLRRIDNLAERQVQLESQFRYVFYDGEVFEILHSNGVATFSNRSYLSKLVFSNTQLEHNGYYACVAANRDGFRYRGTYLTIWPLEMDVDSSDFVVTAILLALVAVFVIAFHVLTLSYVSYTQRSSKSDTQESIPE